MILEEEIEEMLGSFHQCTDNISQENSFIKQIDCSIASLDEKAKLFLEQIKERKHALACKRAAHEEKIRLIKCDQDNWDIRLVCGHRKEYSV